MWRWIFGEGWNDLHYLWRSFTAGDDDVDTQLLDGNKTTVSKTLSFLSFLFVLLLFIDTADFWQQGWMLFDDELLAAGCVNERRRDPSIASGDGMDVEEDIMQIMCYPL